MKNKKTLYNPGPLYRGIHRWQMDSLHKVPAMWKAFRYNWWHCMGWRDYQFLTIAAFRQLYYSMDTIFYMLYNISYRRKIGIFYIKKTLLWKMTGYDIMKSNWNCVYLYIYISCNLSHITSACWLYINPTDSRNRLKFLEIMSRVWANFLSLLMF